MATANLEAINVLHELERIGWAHRDAGGGELRVCCPAHDDSSPSASINVEKRLWRCQVPSCGATGDIISFLALALKVPREVAYKDLLDRYPTLSPVKQIPSQIVEKLHQSVWDSSVLLEELRKRGVTDAMIRSARLGVAKTRITIPVYDESGRCVNLRRYMPGAPGHQKMQNTKGHGAPALYRVGDLERDRVWICAGEIKALVVGELLREDGVGAVAGTAGEGNWIVEWCPKFRDKDVYVCMDIDAAGVIAAKKVAQLVYGFARSVRIVELPLDPLKHPKGDVNDYVGAEGAGREELLRLMDVDPWEPPRRVYEAVDVVDVPLYEAVAGDTVDRRVRFRAEVAAIDDNPYVVPERVRVGCDVSQPGCGTCPLFPLERDANGFVEVDVPIDSPCVLEMVATNAKFQHAAVREYLGVPAGRLCKSFTFATRRSRPAYDVQLTPEIDVTDNTSGRDSYQPALVVGTQTDLNQCYSLVGGIHPHPRSMKATLLIDSVEATASALDSYRPTQEELQELEIFQPDEWTEAGLAAKLGTIYDDFARNVTGILERPRVHELVDCCWHSPLMFMLDDRQQNGWMNVLVIGDSAQGKTEIAEGLSRHYQVGTKVDCKGTSRAGLIGGLEQFNTKKWFVKWGVVPGNDRRLVVLEETKGVDVETIAKMTEMRSSGIASIDKIEKRKTWARTRLLMLSNPRESRAVASFSYRIECAIPLIGALEDLRRLDLAVVVAADDVNLEELTRQKRRRGEPLFGSEHCNRLILWSWTRAPDEVVFDEEAEQQLRDASGRVAKRFGTEALPLLEPATARLKIARVAAALACRTFSCDESYGAVRVRSCHVSRAESTITEEYRASGLDVVAEREKAMRTVTDESLVSKYIGEQPDPGGFVSAMLAMEEVRRDSIEDACNLDRDQARELISVLIRTRCLTQGRRARAYVKTAPFINLLKQLESTMPTSTFENEEY